MPARGNGWCVLGISGAAADAGNCKSYLYTVSYYGAEVAEVVPDGRGRYVSTPPPEPVPCPHRPGEDAGTSQDHSRLTLWWSPDKQTLHGLRREYQVGPSLDPREIGSTEPDMATVGSTGAKSRRRSALECAMPGSCRIGLRTLCVRWSRPAGATP